MIEFAMAMVIFTALPLITRQRSHVTVSLIDGMVTGLGRKIKQVMCDAVSALALGVLTWRLYLQGKDDLESGSATVVLSLPHAPLSLAMAFFTAFSTLMILGLMIRTFKETGDTV